MLVASVLALFAVASAQATDLPFCTVQSSPVPIYDIQGDGHLSPFNGDTLETYGVVTATFYERTQIGGFFVQDPYGDDDPTTSDALFVRKRSGDLPEVGDFVQFSGRVVENNHFTAMTSIQDLVVCETMALPEPYVLSLPISDLAEFEAAEGMLVTFEQPLIITELYDLGRYGRMVLADERLFTVEQFPGGHDVPHTLRRIVLDDGFTTENGSPTAYIDEEGIPPRAGDSVAHVVGVLASEGGDLYRIEPTETVVFERTNPRPEAPDVVGDANPDDVIVIVGFNAYNLFTDVLGRGPSSEEEVERQTAKIVAAITALQADVYGFQEVENDGGRTMERLVAAVNSEVGSEMYSIVRTGVLGTDQITQSVIYRTDSLTPRLVHAAHDELIHDRPPLGVVFEREDGERIVVVVGHFKSKGSCPPSGDIDRGAGCWNLRRSAQAQGTADLGKQLGALANTKNIVLLGDLNSYGNEPPIMGLLNDGWIDLGREMLPREERYSYVYMGEFGTLDYAIVTAQTAERVSGFAYWHINSDEARAFDYGTTWNVPESYRPDEFRSSDHDPVVLGIELPRRAE